MPPPSTRLPRPEPTVPPRTLRIVDGVAMTVDQVRLPFEVVEIALRDAAVP